MIGIVVAALGVINTLMMNVIERQREIGGLRSLGLTRWQTPKWFSRGGNTRAIGGAFGLGLGYWLANFRQRVECDGGLRSAICFVLSIFITGAFIALIVRKWRRSIRRGSGGVNIVKRLSMSDGQRKKERSGSGCGADVTDASAYIRYIRYIIRCQ